MAGLLSADGEMCMESMKIRSFSGEYEVLFCDLINGTNPVEDGDLVIADRKVYEIYQGTFEKWLASEQLILVDATEEQKSFAGIEPVIGKIIQKEFHKDKKLIAIGGGITQDVTAFIASILHRGVNWMHIPTTLLAQCDSCIGSKTSINFGSFKNQIGGFYPPRRILIDLAFLKTLDQKDLLSGMGEMLHYFVLNGEEDFSFFEQNCENALKEDAVLEALIKRTLSIKKAMVEIDEFDRKERQVFNYGHSFGHAIEAETGYRVPHGMAVSRGMDMANYVAVRMGMQSEATRERIRRVAKRYWDSEDLKGMETEIFLNALRRDKKNKGQKLGLILCRDFGDAKKHMIDADEDFCRILHDYFMENTQ